MAKQGKRGMAGKLGFFAAMAHMFNGMFALQYGGTETVSFKGWSYKQHLKDVQKAKERQYERWGVKWWPEYQVWARDEKNAIRKFHNVNKGEYKLAN